MSTDTKEYRSPLRKLTKCFETSRDQWKRKCLTAKQRIKRLHTKVADLQASRERWKSETKQLRQELAQVRRELEQKPAGTHG